MALIDIARQLKKTFDGFETYGFTEQLEEIRKIYKDAELIRIGETDYIVINDEYKIQENNRFSASPLFRGITEPSCAIIDIKTAPSLIDEVYARVTYMRKTFRTDGVPNESDVRKSLQELYGGDMRLDDDSKKTERSIIIADDGISKANIFECRLEKDTGVSASTDTYSFMISGDDIKDIDQSAISEIKSSGEVEFLKDRDAINKNYSAIQNAVFQKYVDSDIVQSIKVKSIFEIALASRNVLVRFIDSHKKIALFKTTQIPSKQNEFDKLNASIHVCNSCKHNLVDIETGAKHKLHVNTDALAEVPTSDDPTKLVYATGCEDCLEQCPECGEWHFNYKKLRDKSIYNNVIFAPERDFVKSIDTFENNYCSCRKNIEWVYDERTGTENKHNIIPIEQMAFVNFSNECIGTYEEWKEYYDKRTRGSKRTGVEQSKFATDLLAKFKKLLAARNEIDDKSIIVTSARNCKTCDVCKGKYVPETYVVGEYRCPMCDVLVSEKLHMLTRVDGVIFMRREVKDKNGKRDVVTKYVMNKLGNLRRIKHVAAVVADDE